MATYQVYLVAVAQAVVEVEADDPDEAIALALENAPAGANTTNDFDMGHWQLASDLWPDAQPENDYEAVK